MPDTIIYALAMAVMILSFTAMIKVQNEIEILNSKINKLTKIINSMNQNNRGVVIEWIQ